jgi:uracil-DNA glycosylase
MLSSLLKKTWPGSHSKIGWQLFTDAVIKKLSDQKRGIIFLLWGNYARSKKVLIDLDNNVVLEAAHPSPLARDAFKGCRSFFEGQSITFKPG